LTGLEKKMSQLRQELIDQLNKTPEEISKLEQTEKKIGDIINWCCYNYQNSDKDATFEKTKEYLAAVLSVSINQLINIIITYL